MVEADAFCDRAIWRVFISHTGELRKFPRGNSYVDEVERAISAAGHVIVDMADFPASGQAPAQVCMDRIRTCDVYVGVLGTRYGSPARDRPQVSYTELEFDTATEAGLPRLMFLLDTSSAEVGIPASNLIDHEFGTRQEAFRKRVQESSLLTQSFTSPADLGRLVERSLRELADIRRASPATPATIVFGEIPHEVASFEQRPELQDQLINSPSSHGVIFCAYRRSRRRKEPARCRHSPETAGGRMASGRMGQRRNARPADRGTWSARDRGRDRSRRLRKLLGAAPAKLAGI